MSEGLTHDRDVWRELVDIERVAAWMDTQGLEAGPIVDAAPLTGGTQNILLKFRRGDRWFVLRRPPRHLRRESNDVMRREARVLAALKGSDVPHPEFIAVCDDASLIGAVFYLMEPIIGFNATEGLPALHKGDAAIRRRMGFALDDGIIALSRVDIERAGIADLSKIDNWLERQTKRWRAQLDSYAQFKGWTGLAALPDVEKICAWLEANRPGTMKPGLLHGDYHFSNVLYRFDGPELAAIVDWELTALGDPLLDLGWLTATWPEPEHEPHAAVAVQPWEGFPPIGEVVARYLEATGRTLAELRWYAVLACFKLGSILEGSHARACAGLTPKPVGDRLHAHTIMLFHRALRRIDDPRTLEF